MRRCGRRCGLANRLQDSLVAGAAAEVARAPRGSRRRWDRGGHAGARSPRRRTRACRTRTAGRGSRGRGLHEKLVALPQPLHGQPRRHRPARRRSGAGPQHRRAARCRHRTHPVLWPRWVPVRLRSPRRKSASVSRGSTSARRTTPFTIVSISTTTNRLRYRCIQCPWRPSPHRPTAAILRWCVHIAGDRVQLGAVPSQLPRRQAQLGHDRRSPSRSRCQARSSPGRSARCRNAPRSSGPSSTATAAPAMAKSPCRRATSSTANPHRPDQTGTRTPVSGSPSSMAVSTAR